MIHSDAPAYRRVWEQHLGKSQFFTGKGYEETVGNQCDVSGKVHLHGEFGDFPAMELMTPEGNDLTHRSDFMIFTIL